MSSWNFYSRDGFLKVGYTTESVANAATLDGIPSSGFVQVTGSTMSGNLSMGGGTHVILSEDATNDNHVMRRSYADGRYLNKGAGNTEVVESEVTIDAGAGANLSRDVASIGDAPAVQDYIWRQYAQNTFLSFTGGTLTGDLTIEDASLYLPVDTVTANTTLDETHRVLLVDTTSTAITLTLPASPTAGQWYEIRDVGSGGGGNASTNNITLDPSTAEIDGSATNRVFDTDGASTIITTDGTNWFTITTEGAGLIVEAMDDLSDAAVTAPEPNQVLKYVAGSTERWVNTSELLVNQGLTQIPKNPDALILTSTATPPTSGNFRITVEVQGGTGSAETANLAYDATVADIQAALEALADLDDENVLVELEDEGPGLDVADTIIRIEFIGPLQNTIVSSSVTSVTLDNPIQSTRNAGQASILLGPDVQVFRAEEDTLSVSSKFVPASGVRLPIGTVSSATHTIDAMADYTVLCDTTSNAVEITLPSNAAAGDTFVIKDSQGNSAVNAVVLVTEGSETIDGDPTFVLDTPYASVQVQFDGDNWFVL